MILDCEMSEKNPQNVDFGIKIICTFAESNNKTFDLTQSE